MVLTNRSVVSVFGLRPIRVGGVETYARELSVQLNRAGWKSILVFASEPATSVRRFLEHKNVCLEVLETPSHVGWHPSWKLMRILARHRPEILHLSFVGFVSPYPWLGKLLGSKKIFFTDQSSHPEDYVPRRAPVWRPHATVSESLVTSP